MIKDTTIDTLPFGGAEFGKLVALVDAKAISNNQGKQVLAEMLTNGGDRSRNTMEANRHRDAPTQLQNSGDAAFGQAGGNQR